MPETATPVDRTKLDELRDLFGDEAALGDLFRDFFADLPERLCTLRSGVQTGTCEVVNRTAHLIKGSSGNLGATGVQEAARRLEEGARRNDLSHAPAALDRLEAELARLREWLQAEGLI